MSEHLTGDEIVYLMQGQTITAKHEGVNITLHVTRPMHGRLRDMAALLYLEWLEEQPTLGKG